ncbi:hypothetical protein GCM10009840_00710 [Pseudolysinimonas kribbensis]|uniref:Uncharacterized protein n=1 Tax=Pseudolysinimonas kribbensis TaxID=433641 RepID=A0ABQ6KAN5_9MICO|nr:hypothetical protein [Pseudolysinimonas kribbensis]GMA95822.1 hypothetical protein GCM10025881_26460 [Pseudolysinimonas kribbensis]
MAWQIGTVVPVWVVALAGAVVVAVIAPGRSLVWLPIVMALCVLVTIAIQLGVQRKEGFVTRLILSFSGALVIVGLATAALSLGR